MIKSGTISYRYARKRIILRWNQVFLALILALTGFLSFYAVWNEGYSNTYYAAAVKSMLSSFHNFFFASLDAGGYVSVDKPPLGLWIQAFSATIFGFQGWSLILPQAIAAVVSAALIYHLVQRRFGKPAGLISALVFALTPIVGAVSRTNNFDTIVVMLLLFGAWALIVAAEKGSVKLLLLSVALVGLGFNVKMLQAFMVLPAFYLVYLLSPAHRPSKKILHLCIATILLLAISLSWAVIVDTTPADLRPYVGSSQTNSVIELALGYNGIQRVLPSGSPMGAFTASPGHDGMPEMPPMGNAPEGIPPGMAPVAGNVTARPMPGGFAGPGGEGGEAGIFRLFNQQMAGQISWLLPLAIVGFFSTLVVSRKNKHEDSRERSLSLYLWGMWMLPMLVYFSEAGFFHRYYLIMLAPAIAALCGIGLTSMWNEYRGGGPLSYLLPMSLAVAAIIESLLVSRYPDLARWLIPVICVAGLASASALAYARYSDKIALKKITRPLLGCGIAALLIAPALWSVTPILYGSQSQLPYAGPELADSGMGQGLGSMSDRGLIEFLLNHTGTERFLVAVPSAMNAAGIIIETGKPVMAVGGFSGADQILTVDRLEEMAANGEIRYYLLTGFQEPSQFPAGNDSTGFTPPFGGMPGGQSEVNDWVKAHGKLVSSSEWEDEPAIGQMNATDFPPMRNMQQLYDLKG